MENTMGRQSQIGVIEFQVKEHQRLWEPPKARRDKEGFSPRNFGERPYRHLDFGLVDSELRGSKFQLF